jgi:hypothetical protein
MTSSSVMVCRNLKGDNCRGEQPNRLNDALRGRAIKSRKQRHPSYANGHYDEDKRCTREQDGHEAVNS